MGRLSIVRLAAPLLALALACASGARPGVEPHPEGEEVAAEPAAASPAPGAAEAAPAPRSDAAPAEASAPEVVLAAAGDVVINPRALASARSFDDEGGFARMIAGLAEALSPSDDLVLANLETPLVDDVNPLSPGWPPILGATPGLSRALAAAGVQVVSVANNHAYDQSHVGLSRTLETLAGDGIVAVGAGPTVEAAFAPARLERRGLRVAVLAFTDSMNRQARLRGHDPVHVARLWDDARAVAAVEAAAREADLVVLSLHWSTDFVMEPTAAQRRQARLLVDAGADVILGTGPHVLQPVERMEGPRGEAVVAYSLGNIVSGMGQHYVLGHPPHGYVHPANVRPEARDGLVLRLRVARVEGRLVVRAIEGTPTWTLNNYLDCRRTGARHDIRVVPLSEAPDEVRAERLPAIRAALGPEVAIEG